MKVFGLSLGAPLTTPYPTSKFGIIFRLLGGNVIYPMGDGKWFEPPYFSKVINFYMPLPIMPYFSIRLGKYGFYIGCKVFGVDSEAYKNWLPPEEVYEGSQAMMLISIRFSSTLQ